MCTRCHRLMYRKTVIEFRLAKYTKLSDKLLHRLFPPSTLYSSKKYGFARLVIQHLRKATCLNQAKANNLVLEPIPPQLKGLNEMEIQQKAIHGQAVSV